MICLNTESSKENNSVMKNSLLTVFLSIITFSCNITYETTVSGVANTASIKVVKANKAISDYDEELTLIIDNKEYLMDKVYSEKKSLKAAIYPITPGKHNIIIKSNDYKVYEKTLFITNRETRIIILE